ncbi:hypothetical protein [Guptibacillus algicola]|uniref:hypothetical protein n=1 Tax=Guptibacillus algicola TaxID=225844 RepID=UPI001CD4DB26|nr:hypothetical protein [Alkalihalobacillus algicola]MCA0987079.1 hypothetical protein [Alkalihalobacillus algicola]
MELLLEILANIGGILGIGGGDAPDEEKIEENIVALMAFSWFTDLTKHPQGKPLIMKNESVRYVIGKMRVKKMKKSPMYEDRMARKLKKTMNKQLAEK